MGERKTRRHRNKRDQIAARDALVEAANVVAGMNDNTACTFNMASYRKAMADLCEKSEFYVKLTCRRALTGATIDGDCIKHLFVDGRCVKCNEIESVSTARAALVEAAIDWYTVTGIVIEAAEEAGESSLNLNDKVRAYRRALSGEKGGGVMGAERQRLTKKIRPRSKKDLTFSRKTPLIPPIGGQGGI